jgi:hypothetical protein
MPATDIDPLHALSLARTALDDSAALPDGSVVDVDATLAARSRAMEVAFAITLIDRAIDGLYFEPFDAPVAAADVTLANLGRLLASVTEGLDQYRRFDDAAVMTRDAVARVTAARVLLTTARS